jgi:hypothetical protein
VNNLSGWKRYDPVLWLIVAAFVIFEIVAHYTFHNSDGMETLSHEIAAFETKYGWPARLLVAAAVVALGVHLEGGF